MLQHKLKYGRFNNFSNKKMRCAKTHRKMLYQRLPPLGDAGPGSGVAAGAAIAATGAGVIF